MTPKLDAGLRWWVLKKKKWSLVISKYLCLFFIYLSGSGQPLKKKTHAMTVMTVTIMERLVVRVENGHI